MSVLNQFEQYYRNELLKLNKNTQYPINVKFHDGDNHQTKFMSLNNDSALMISRWLNQHYEVDKAYLTDKELKDELRARGYIVKGMFQKEDVRMHRSDLDEDQLDKVVKHLEDSFDANLGIDWETIDAAADYILELERKAKQSGVEEAPAEYQTSNQIGVSDKHGKNWAWCDLTDFLDVHFVVSSSLNDLCEATGQIESIYNAYGTGKILELAREITSTFWYDNRDSTFAGGEFFDVLNDYVDMLDSSEKEMNLIYKKHYKP